MVLKGLKPEKVFEYFELLCSVPHGSGNTKQISDLCVNFAKEHGLKCRQDEFNNVVIFKDATVGYENAETIILQGHMDMVCAAEPDCGIDMKTDGLNLLVDGDWIKAKGTSLGGDNCIAVAIIMAILADDNMAHPALEAVFTTDEETGMDGAMGLDVSDLKGKCLINLDSEEEGFLTVSCAGGIRTECVFKADFETLPENYSAVKIVIEGLKGGHSGVDIDKGRASATELIGRLLYKAEKEFGIRLCSISGGTFTNVIPLYCEAVVAVENEKLDQLVKLCKDYEEMFKFEYAAVETGLALNASIIGKVAKMASVERSRKIFSFMLLSPYGVQAMSMDIPGLVQTSLNLGVAATGEENFILSYSIRSSILSQKLMLVERLEELCAQFDATMSCHAAYPGWAFRKESKLRDALSASCAAVLGKVPEITATHGGLECGLFMEKISGLDCVSLGPNLKEVHSVREQLNISSTERLYRIICNFLGNWK